MGSPKITLKPGKDKPLRNHHPWIFSGAIARIEDAQPGDTVDIYSADRGWLARAGFNPRSQIVARVWTFERDEAINRDFFVRRVNKAQAYRETLNDNLSEISAKFQKDYHANAFRVVHAESDGLPGVVVDRYADFLVIQFLTLGAEAYKAEIVAALQTLAPRGIYERSDVDVRKREGLRAVTGNLWGEEPPEQLQIVENDLRFLVDVRRGHKTGFYLDQRVNRERVAPLLKGDVLNAFAYTGAFGVYAAKRNGAQVVNLDASAAVLELADKNMELNAVKTAENVVADAFEKLREFRAASRQFDAIILDPPKFVTSQANLERATRGYKDLNLLALQLLRPDGFLVTFSCSGLVDAKLFQQIVFGASVDAGRDAQILERLGQAPDHPIGLAFPEGEYLKGLVLRVQ